MIIRNVENLEKVYGWQLIICHDQCHTPYKFSQQKKSYPAISAKYDF